MLKKLVLVLAAVVLLTTVTVPSFADGNPIPICDKNGKNCTLTVPSFADGNPIPICDKNGKNCTL